MEHGQMLAALCRATASRERERLQVFPERTGTEQQSRKLRQLRPRVPFLGKGAVIPQRLGNPSCLSKAARVMLCED